MDNKRVRKEYYANPTFDSIEDQYDEQQWKDPGPGLAREATTFILNDTQIMYESFLEDINNILNTGDITGLYEPVDVARMAECMGPILTKKKIPVTRDNIKQGYIESLRDQFHIMLCMSPVGELLRVRSRMFPSLINCCTLNWFDSWPYEALVSVAQ